MKTNKTILLITPIILLLLFFLSPQNILSNIILMLLTIIQGVFSFFPVLIIILYGLNKTTILNTFLIVFFSQIISSAITHNLGKKKFSSLEKKILSKKLKKKLDSRFQRNGFIATLFTRYIFLPSGAVSLFAGASHVKEKHFFIANLLSFGPLTLLTCMLGVQVNKIINLKTAIVIALIFFVVVLLKRIKNERTR
jgi:uncharacterized membrane protein YdjX (TVP38/TMEM64 family)